MFLFKMIKCSTKWTLVEAYISRNKEKTYSRENTQTKNSDASWSKTEIKNKSKKYIYLGEELLGGTIIGDGFLISWVDYDTNIAVGIEVVLISKNLSWEFPLFAWVPLWGDG